MEESETMDSIVPSDLPDGENDGGPSEVVPDSSVEQELQPEVEGASVPKSGTPSPSPKEEIVPETIPDITTEVAQKVVPEVLNEETGHPEAAPAAAETEGVQPQTPQHPVTTSD
jgi:hypothetical protein